MYFPGSLALALIPLILTPPNILEVPGIGLQVPTILAERVDLDNNRHTWTVPCTMSASSITEGGNITLFGHRDICGGVFDGLPQLTPGDEVFYDGHRYIVSETDVVGPTEVWPLQDFGDVRLTLISCWPPGSTTQRYVVVALQASGETSGPAVAQPPAPLRTGTSRLGAGSRSYRQRCMFV